MDDTWCVYVLRVANGHLYTGITNDINKRLKTHASGKGSKFVSAHLPFVLVYTEPAANKSAALKREAQIKKLSKKQKELLIEGETKMTFPIEPLFDRVFIKKDDATVDKNTGFLLPDSVKGRAETGTVVAAGPGYVDLLTGKFIPMSLKVGDRVLLKAFDGYILRYGGHEVFVFNEKEVLGKVVGE